MIPFLYKSLLECCEIIEFVQMPDLNEHMLLAELETFLKRLKKSLVCQQQEAVDYVISFLTSMKLNKPCSPPEPISLIMLELLCRITWQTYKISSLHL